jgi:hypothetical protein
MKSFESWTDLVSIGIGVLGAFTKGVKKRLGVKETFLGMLVGAILAFGTIGIIDQFFSHLNEKIVIVISFAVGWVANEMTEYLDNAIKAWANKVIKKVGGKIDEK